MRVFRFGRTLIALSAVLALSTASVEARPGGGGSFGSRGMRTYSAPPPTATAPGQIAPIQRSIAQPGAGPMAAQAPSRGFFGRGLMSGILGGLLGAGLFGLLMGNGMGSIFWLILQVGLIFLVIRFAMALFGRRAAPAGTGPLGRDRMGPNYPQDGFARNAGPGSAGGVASPGAQVGPPPVALAITAQDYAEFERLLGEIQTAYGREDVAVLRRMATPEMAGYFEEELTGNARKGQVNRISGVRLLQGDLAESWREADADFATVAMRYALNDAMVDRASGRVLAGDLARPQEATEVWTFRRPRSGVWQLSAIQQA